MKPAARLFLYGQIVFVAALAVAVALRPHGLSANDGISYYGIYKRTFAPYAISLLGAAYFTMRTADALPSAQKLLRRSLRLYTILVTGLVVTPYAAGMWVDYLHTSFGSALFFLQLCLSGWLCWKLAWCWWAVALSLLELAAGIASAIYLTPSHGFLLQTQVVFQLAFGALFILYLQTLKD